MYTSIITALLVAALFGIIISMAFKKTGPGPGNGLLFVFAIIFMFSWGIGSWITPTHPMHVSYPWLSYFFVGLFVMMLLTLTLPPSTPKINKKVEPDDLKKEEVSSDKAFAVGFGLFFWMMLVSLIIFGTIHWV